MQDQVAEKLSAYEQVKNPDGFRPKANTMVQAIYNSSFSTVSDPDSPSSSELLLPGAEYYDESVSGSDLSSSKCSHKPYGGELSQRRPSWSVGAALHHAGKCSPCAWHWKPCGCCHGEACKFCHMCGDGQAEERRRALMAKARGHRHERKLREMEKWAKYGGWAAPVSDCIEAARNLGPDQRCNDPHRLSPEVLQSLQVVYNTVGHDDCSTDPASGRPDHVGKFSL